jgi:molybdate transport system ATP-binding protein
MPRQPTPPAGSRRAAHDGLCIDLEGLHLERGGRRILERLDWRLRPGQRWVLQGENGAGKTQLLKLIAGDVWPQPRAGSRRRYRWLGEWHDEPLLAGEHIAYLGAERQDRYSHYEWNFRALGVVCTGFQRSDIPMAPFTAAQRAAARALLRRTGCEAVAQRRFLTLSQGEQRLVLLARALAWRPALLLLDEPFNGLDEAHRGRMRLALAGLRRMRLSWIIATHRPEEVPDGATHIATLSGGRLRTGRWRAPAPAPGGHEPRPGGRRGTPATGRLLLQAQGLSVWHEGQRALQPVSFDVRAGECWVVHGPNGSGKSTLLGALYGEYAVAAPGRLLRAGRHAALAGFQRQVGRVSPQLQAQLPRAASALWIVVGGLRQSFGLLAPPGARERLAARAALRLCAASDLADRPFGTLSYGQARRVLFARALVRRPAILLLDEALTGLDARTRAALAALLDGPALAHTTLIMASHHRDEWPQRTSHELELRAGKARYAGALRRPVSRPVSRR